MRAAWTWLRTPRGVVLVACGFAVVLRLPFVGLPPYTDEGGLLVVARSWHTGGPDLYGRLFVDRPPLLLLYFRLSDVLGGVTAVRVVALGLVVVLVAAAGWAGLLLGGRRGAACAALASAALLANPALGAHEVNGETVGAPLTVVACALLVGVYAGPSPSRARRTLLLGGAGAAAVCAILVKQNLVDALVFGLVAVVASGPRDEWRRTWRDLETFLAGALVPAVATVAWAQAAGPGVSALWFTLYRFRLDALHVIASQSTAAPQARIGVLWHAALVSGLLLLVLAALWSLRRRVLTRDPLTWALTAMLAAEIAGVVGGGSYWTHYLIALVPGAALLAGRAAGVNPRGWLVPLAVAVTVVSCLVQAGGSVAAGRSATVDAEARLADWLSAASRPGDSGVVVYGAADLFATTPLRPAYPYLWTLPMRTLDPHLDRLVGLLAGADAPTFVVERMPADSWGIDPQGRVDRALARHYRPAGSVCGVPVYVHDGVARRLPPLPTGCAG
ncbi:hypothetical protein [Nocardioides cynanchi]|uniref:hypothetical protein n=1 Tax=Nocardioides cynanchi TaxID=2558918 RepID=UPI001243D44A|nr:hypothetical protein [Nocardioides cynanchi]